MVLVDLDLPNNEALMIAKELRLFKYNKTYRSKEHNLKNYIVGLKRDELLIDENNYH
jgi:hypothetical protein